MPTAVCKKLLAVGKGLKQRAEDPTLEGSGFGL